MKGDYLPSLEALEWAWAQPDEHEGSTTWRAFCIAMVVASLERHRLPLEALRFNNGNGDQPAKLERVA